MTERPLSISTQIAPPNHTGFRSATATSANDALTSTESGVEDYTIKCICEWDQDDGATVYCDSCDTWQHIECFYPGRVADASREDFDHSCADCKPRALDRQRAIDYQQGQRQIKADSGDKKSKRAPSKSHKKKSKPLDLLINGHHSHDDHRNGSPQDHHPHTKKTKGHRSKESVSSQLKRSPPYHSRQPSHAHPPSPAHTPPDLPHNFRFHDYSDLFVSIYTGPQPTPTNTNSMASIGVTNLMSAWLNDEEKLRADVGRGRDEVFQFLTAPPDTLSWPDLKVDRQDITIDDAGTVVSLPCLRAPHNLKRGHIGELNGTITLQSDYCKDGETQWMEGYNHPKPLFFFLPHLPLVVDTRLEGSKCHNVRRSCQANASLDIFIDSSRPMGYHFWLAGDQAITTNEQITISWDFRFPSKVASRFLHLLNLNDEDGEHDQFDTSDITDDEYETLSNLIRVVLSDFGGCACGLGNDCSFVRFHRNYHGRSQVQTNGIRSKKGRKTNKRNPVSPTSTGHATDSRAASEAQDQYDEDDRRSPSGSSTRSKPGSRDLTPINGICEPNGILSSDREKRKIAMVEVSFRKMEQGQPLRKKKRASDGATNSPTTQTTSKSRKGSIAPRMTASLQHKATTPNGIEKRQYVDASTNRRQSDSPRSVASPNLASNNPGSPRQIPTTSKATYTDASTMVNMDEDAWYRSSSQRPTVKKPIIPLAKRLLMNRQRMNAQRLAQPALRTDDHGMVTSPTLSMDLDTPVLDERGHPDSPTSARGRHGSIASSSPSVEASDVNMSDALPMLVNNTIKPPPPPWPSHPLITSGPAAVPGQKSPNLRVQMPPTPTFSMPFMSRTPSPSVTPSSAAVSMAQSPFGTNFPGIFPVANGLNAIACPIKTTKKLSLSDYKRKRENANKMEPSGTSKSPAGSSPIVAPAVLKPSLSTLEEAKAAGGFEGSAIIESPTAEIKADPALPTGPKAEPATINNMPSEEANGIL